LPEDSPKAMLTLCNILHHNTNSLELRDNFDEFKSFFIVTDKYDTLHASLVYGRSWLERYSNHWGRAEPDIWNWSDRQMTEADGEKLALAYYFDDFRTFSSITSDLVERPNGPNELWAYSHVYDKFPKQICRESSLY
jgi:hypothetical protein